MEKVDAMLIKGDMIDGDDLGGKMNLAVKVSTENELPNLSESVTRPILNSINAPQRKEDTSNKSTPTFYASKLSSPTHPANANYVQSSKSDQTASRSGQILNRNSVQRVSSDTRVSPGQDGSKPEYRLIKDPAYADVISDIFKDDIPYDQFEYLVVRIPKNSPLNPLGKSQGYSPSGSELQFGSKPVRGRNFKGYEGQTRRRYSPFAGIEYSKGTCETVGRSNEPITYEIENIRKRACSASNKIVEKVKPGLASNPANVKVVESVLSEQDFKSFFPKANKAYTYENFLKAFAKYPGVCTSKDVCKKTLATMFAHFEQETWGLYYIEEIHKSDYCAAFTSWIKRAYPCVPRRQYYGRGSKQLSWNYNYGAFSVAMFGDARILLENPDLVATTWLNFASAIWFYLTPQPPKPSMLSVVDGTWKPNEDDYYAYRDPGFGSTIMIINGALECGPNPSNKKASRNRQMQYRRFADHFNIDISQENSTVRTWSPST